MVSKMAEGSVELVEGARIVLKITINETLEGDVVRKFNEAAEKSGRILTKKDTGERYMNRKLPYPFPAGLIADPLTGKPARTDMTTADIGKAIAAWLSQIDQLRKAGGKFVMVMPDGSKAEGVTVLTVPGSKADNYAPVDVLPSLFGESGIFGKGFKLGIQGPVNSAMVDQFMTVTKKGKVAKSASGGWEPNSTW